MGEKERHGNGGLLGGRPPLLSGLFFFHAFYFGLRQTNKQNSPSVDSHERARASLLQASNSFYSYILHSTSTTCCISNQKPSRLTFAARSEHAGSLSSLLACWLPSKFELALLPCRLTFRRAENLQCLSRVHQNLRISDSSRGGGIV